jgi:hypothetical protein
MLHSRTPLHIKHFKCFNVYILCLYCALIAAVMVPRLVLWTHRSYAEGIPWSATRLSVGFVCAGWQRVHVSASTTQECFVCGLFGTRCYHIVAWISKI